MQAGVALLHDVFAREVHLGRQDIGVARVLFERAAYHDLRAAAHIRVSGIEQGDAEFVRLADALRRRLVRHRPPYVSQLPRLIALTRTPARTRCRYCMNQYSSMSLDQLIFGLRRNSAPKECLEIFL